MPKKVSTFFEPPNYRAIALTFVGGAGADIVPEPNSNAPASHAPLEGRAVPALSEFNPESPRPVRFAPAPMTTEPVCWTKFVALNPKLPVVACEPASAPVTLFHEARVLKKLLLSCQDPDREEF